MREESGHHHAEVEVARDSAGDGAPTRRDVVRNGVKLVFLAPVVSTFFAHEAYASNYSCYPQGHACSLVLNREPCCGGLTCRVAGINTKCLP